MLSRRCNLNISIMASSTLHRVAIEFGFPEKIVNRALRQYKFLTAGEFVNYLEDHFDELERQDPEEEVEKEVERREKNITILGPPDVKEEIVEEVNAKGEVQLTLRQETEILYNQSLCLKCWTYRRAFVCLPCCHFSLCERCKPSTEHCPLRSCGEKIECTIKTYV